MKVCEMCGSADNWLCSGCGTCECCGWHPGKRATVNVVQCCDVMTAAWSAKLNQS